DRLKIFDPNAKDRPQGGDDGGGVEVVVVGGPPEGCAQSGQLGCEPGVRLTLSGAVPQGEDVSFAPGEMAGMRGPSRGCRSMRGGVVLGGPAGRSPQPKTAAVR